MTPGAVLLLLCLISASIALNLVLWLSIHSCARGLDALGQRVHELEARAARFDRALSGNPIRLRVLPA